MLDRWKSVSLLRSVREVSSQGKLLPSHRTAGQAATGSHNLAEQKPPWEPGPGHTVIDEGLEPRGGPVIRLPFLRFTSRRVTWFSQGMLEKNPRVLPAGGEKGTIVKHPRHSALSTRLPSGNVVNQSLTCWRFIST